MIEMHDKNVTFEGEIRTVVVCVTSLALTYKIKYQLELSVIETDTHEWVNCSLSMCG